MFTPIFKDDVQAQKIQGRYVAAELEVPSSRKHKCVIKMKENEENGDKIPIIFATIMTK